jgi:hypothetical protein
MRSATILAVLGVLLAPGAPPAAARAPRVVRFEPELVELSGTVQRRSFLINPGSGRSTSEAHLVLSLEEPVVVASARGDLRVEVAELQIASASLEWLQPLLGHRVLLTGTLFPGHTRHHFTQVMVWARRATAAP